MRNVAIFLFLFFSLFFIGQVNAQTPTVSSCGPNLAIPVVGINCGNGAGNACTNRCCFYEPKEQKADLPILGDVLKLLHWENPLDPLLKYQTQLSVEPCVSGYSPSTPGDLTNPGCTCIKPTEVPLTSLVSMCSNIKKDTYGNKSQEELSCEKCMVPVVTGGPVGVWTGVGCMGSNIGSFIQETLLGWGVGLAGGISMLCIMYAAFMMQTSGGEAEKIKKAQQLMTSCITGLMLIIFSVFILQLIGVRILRIPGFS